MKFKTSSVKNGQKHDITNRDNIKRLKHFINVRWSTVQDVKELEARIV